MIIIGNVLVLVIVLGDRELRSTAMNKFIVSRAVADLMVGVFVAPVAVYAKV
jgi:hypothetical protein